MLFKLRNLAAGAVFAIAAACIAQPAQAAFYTNLATIDANSTNPVAGPPIGGIADIEQIRGHVFTNTYGVDAATGGFFVRAVGITVINDFLDNNNNPFGPIVQGPGAGTHQLVIAFAIDGHTSAAAPNEATFTSGGFGVWQSSLTTTGGTFSATDPTKWFNFDATNPANLAANLIYSATLAKPTDIFPGNNNLLPPAAGIPASIVNTSTLNSGTGAEAQGRFLFDTKTDPGPLELSAGTQGKFISIDSGFVIPPGTEPGAVGVLSITHEFTDPAVRGVLPDFLDTAAKQEVVNNIAAFNGLSLLVSGGFSGNFATFGSHDISDYTPLGVTSNGLSVTGDFSGNLKADSAAGLEAVPEPGSMTLLATGSILGGLFARRRKNAKKA